MQRPLLLSALLLVPATALALNYSDATSRYSDQPFSLGEAAGISVLTHLGAIEGNPDGSFAAERTLNRAEFVKIVLLSDASISVSDDDAADCFPDVHRADWFSKYMCLAKVRGMIEGYPDGMFHPERPVNYVEAVKILTELFDLPLNPVEGDQWFEPYMRAAQRSNVLLPVSITNDAALTRGQMARLTAAFVADSFGELDLYRNAERGISESSSSSSSSSSSISSSKSSSSSFSSSSSSSTASIAASTSHFMVAGTTTPIVMDGLYTNPDTDGPVQSVYVELFREVKGLDALVLVDEQGTEIATMALQKTNNTDKTKWYIDISSGSYVLKNDESVRLGIKAQMKTVALGGLSNELFEVRSHSLWVLSNGNSRQIVPSDTHYPLHQTSFGRMKSVENTLGSNLTVQEGLRRTLGTFTVSGMSATGTTLMLDSINFLLEANDVNVTALKIGGVSDVQQNDCGVDKTEERTILICPLPEGFKSVGDDVTFSVYATLSLMPSRESGYVRLANEGTGSIGNNGTLRWTDGSGTFNWVEADVTIQNGPAVTVTK